jgi:chromosome segregation ATPase
MMRRRGLPVGKSVCALLVAAVLVAAACPALAQQDRERAQLLQMQQQLQRLQSDNAALQSSARQDSEKLKKQTEASEAAQRDAKRLRAKSDAQTKEADDLRGQLAHAQETLTAAQAEIERLRKDVAQRDKSLEEATEKQRMTEAAGALVAQRLKLQTARGDQCETKHADALKLASSLVDRIEHDRLRLCEPVTGIWKVKAETDIQDLRQSISDLSLDADHQPAKQ